MTFNSLTFALFFLAVLGAYWWIVPAPRRNAVLLVASYIFYGAWDVRFLGLLGLSTIVDFSVGLMLGRSTDAGVRRRLLGISLAVNLSVLGFFKYFDFFVGSFARLLEPTGLDASSPGLRVLLPVGISFYTFQTMSYTIDVYRKRLEPARSLINFATYVAYFPQLVAGPIERAHRLLPLMQDQTSRHFPAGQERTDALGLIGRGLVKKVVIADGLSPIVSEVYGAPNGYSSAAVWMAIIGFSIQIYGDFSGYSDIARGVSALLGIPLVVNFRQPYLSRNITDFWRRWHISLSDWLRDYVYIPLGGNRRGHRRTLINLMLTMLLGGLWHGAAWTFVVWGGLHGFFLVVHRLASSRATAVSADLHNHRRSVAATFLLTSLGWVFFRSEGFDAAWDMLSLAVRPWTGGAFDTWDAAIVGALALLSLTMDILERRASNRHAQTFVPRTFAYGSACGGALALLLLFSGGSATPFIYFQF